MNRQLHVLHHGERGKQRALLADAVDVGGTKTLNTMVVQAETVDAHIISPDHQDVRFVGGLDG